MKNLAIFMPFLRRLRPKNRNSGSGERGPRSFGGRIGWMLRTPGLIVLMWLAGGCGPSAEDEVGRGVELFNQGKFDEAAVAFKAASSKAPDRPEPHNNLGIVYATRGLYEEAVAEYQKAVQLDPDNAEPHYNLGNAYSALKQRQAAAAAYERALALAPERGEIHYNLAAVYYELDVFDKAWKHLRLASHYGAPPNLVKQLEGGLLQITGKPLD